MIDSINIEIFVRAAVLLIAGWFLARVVVGLVENIPTETLSAHGRSVLRQVLRYGIYLLFFIMIIRQFGFDMSVLLGAAGILTLAVGFASQTSASNLIAGVFLISERAFSVGDVIKVGDIAGEVLSIDLLSAKLRTFDNLYVRIPNENLMKSAVTTISKFAIRRYDLKIGAAYKEDIRQVRDVLLQVTKDFHRCLDEPAPLVIIQGFGDSSVDLQFSVWGAKKRFLIYATEFKNGLKKHSIERK
ncbi:MAG: small-conductance mechanosensitive channel [Candidatus Azotimanducaceae bacterium]|jgi:small-conductance mechanosensitive channel